MIFGGATATVFYNLRRRHQTLGCPVIDYDLALLFQPMQILGISIGVALNVLFAEWMIILLLVIVFLGNKKWPELLFILLILLFCFNQHSLVSPY